LHFASGHRLYEALIPVANVLRRSISSAVLHI
jgi:hypothetical protein